MRARACLPEAGQESWEPKPSLLLVPCRRPTDVLAVLGWDFSQMPYPIMTALLRSWEERFAAVPVQIDPSAIVLNVGRPPQHRAQAERLVAEFTAVCEVDIQGDADEWLHRMASRLLPRRASSLTKAKGSPLAPAVLASCGCASPGNSGRIGGGPQVACFQEFHWDRITCSTSTERSSEMPGPPNQ